jgi:osmotically-inducible protein OsmY
MSCLSTAQQRIFDGIGWICLAVLLSTVSGCAGRYGRTPAARAPDTAALEDRIHWQVNSAIERLTRGAPFDYIVHRLDAGTVTLMGRVTRPELKRQVEEVVRNIEGVRSVADEIQVLASSPADEWLRYALYDAIYGDSALNHYAFRHSPPIYILVSHGQVTLLGAVDSIWDRQIAEVEAVQFPGVVSVTNGLRVEPGYPREATAGAARAARPRLPMDR